MPREPMIPRRSSAESPRAATRRLGILVPLSAAALLSGCPRADPARPVGAPVQDMAPAAQVAAPPPEVTRARRTKLEVVRVDDTVDPFVGVSEGAIPGGGAISLEREQVPVGGGRTVQTRYARLRVGEGEPRQAALERFRAWLGTLPLPPGARFGVEEVVEYDDQTKKATVLGVRTFVLVGESVLHAEDVTDATVVRSDTDQEPDIYVAVTLSPEAAKRFEDLTREWTRRRLAIVVDDAITSAPVIQQTIRGGRISITLGGVDVAKKLEEARRLERELRRR